MLVGVAMKTKSESDTKSVGDLSNDKTAYWYQRVRDVRDDFGKRIEKISSESAPTIADRLRRAYYQSVLRLFESLPPETLVNAGFTMSMHCSDHQKEVSQINAILDYLVPEGGAGSPHGRAIYLGPLSRKSSTKKGRPVKRRSAALRALQLQIDTGRTWLSITQDVCGCEKQRHDQACTEAIRQSVNGLKRFLRQHRIELPKTKH
jgi:hypothetical protein